MTYWIVVGSEENMRIAESCGFDMFGFKSTRRGEVSKVKPEIILAPDQYLDVREIAPTLAFTQRWGENWRLALQGNLHEIPEEDYEKLASLMLKPQTGKQADVSA